jgi:hypothetical protein
MTHRLDWVEALLEFIESRRQLPHAWGMNDCCMFCADAVQTITGVDPAAAWRGSYSDQAGAEAILAEHGGLEAFVTSIMGEPTGPLCARRGDICLIAGPKGLLTGVCVGTTIAAPGDVEQIMFPLSKAIKTWQVD